MDRKRIAVNLTNAPAKPNFGAACNGCGFCCAHEVCDLGKLAFGNIDGPCPAMDWHNGRFACGMVIAADRLGPEYSGMIRFRLGIGYGCDADDELETTTERKC